LRRDGGSEFCISPYLLLDVYWRLVKCICPLIPQRLHVHQNIPQSSPFIADRRGCVRALLRGVEPRPTRLTSLTRQVSRFTKPPERTSDMATMAHRKLPNSNMECDDWTLQNATSQNTRLGSTISSFIIVIYFWILGFSSTLNDATFFQKWSMHIFSAVNKSSMHVQHVQSASTLLTPCTTPGHVQSDCTFESCAWLQQTDASGIPEPQVGTAAMTY
jgi:hypothetical protein